MSNKDTAIYMIPTGCTLTALLVAESCYDNGMLWLPIMLLASAGIVIFVKKKTSERWGAETDANFDNHTDALYHKSMPYGRES